MSTHRLACALAAMVNYYDIDGSETGIPNSPVQEARDALAAAGYAIPAPKAGDPHSKHFDPPAPPTPRYPPVRSELLDMLTRLTASCEAMVSNWQMRGGDEATVAYLDPSLKQARALLTQAGIKE